MMPGNAGMTQEQTATKGDIPEVATPKTELEYEQEFPNRVSMKMTEENVPECVNKGTFVSLTQAGAKTVCVAHLFFKVLKLRNLRSAQKASRYAQTLYSSDELIQMVTTSWVFESKLLGTHEEIWKDLNDEPPYDPKEYVKFDFQSKPAKIPKIATGGFNKIMSKRRDASETPKSESGIVEQRTESRSPSLESEHSVPEPPPNNQRHLVHRSSGTVSRGTSTQRISSSRISCQERYSRGS